MEEYPFYPFLSGALIVVHVFNEKKITNRISNRAGQIKLLTKNHLIWISTVLHCFSIFMSDSAV